ncbi:AAA family ATPase [Actinokineospora sp. G85]|uniref:helix-turn-helix transcriptional regulator n=1 Tax=Actinokineospora sp. G85 TaxID=3406626 RepID=UPI003C7736E0
MSGELGAFVDWISGGRLHGRGPELARFDALLADSRCGRGNTHLVSGPVGSGKTALLQACVDRVDDALVLTATAAADERDVEVGVLEQLLRSGLLPEEADAAVSALLGELPGSGRPHARPPVADLVQGLCSAILELTRHRLVVLAVDDLQHADPASLQALLYLQRRMRSRRMLVLLTELTPAPPALSVFHAELFRRPGCHRAKLRLLSVDEAAAVVGPELAPAALAATGGNPLLLAALAEDAHAAVAEPDGLVVAESYRGAVSSALLRMDARTVETATGLAVLGGPADPARLARLLSLPAQTVGQAIGALTDTGLVSDGGFRHPSAAMSTLDTLSPEGRADLHLRAACLLHAEGAPPRVVAAQLTTSGQATEPWMVELLRDVADEALAADEIERAADCLELALFACQDEPGRAAVMALLARIEWRNNPSAAVRYMRPLRVALRRGRLDDRDAGMLVRYLLWDGRIDQAEETLAWWAESVPGGSEELRFTRRWLRHCCPALLSRRGEGEDRVEVAADGVSVAASSVEAVDALAAMLSTGPSQGIVDCAERVLQSQRMDDTNIEALCSALEVLLCAGRLDDARTWCDRLLAEAAARRATTWEALLSGIRAEIALRKTDLPAAVTHARTALDLMPTQDWGVFVGGPLSALVLALTMMVRHDEAERELRRPVPKELFETRYGLQYLYARGCHGMAVDRPHAALADFENCGRLMTSWRIDLPALVPWRSGAAEALLRLGRTDRARTLAEEQLDRPGVAGTRTRGVSLRILAACADPEARGPLLEEAADLLQADEERLELATVLADLSNANHSLGHHLEARTLADQAIQVARLSTAEQFWQRTRPPARLTALSDTDGAATLSPAERPVAQLAAAGHTNREIGRKLFITVSTVEQHLTRVYRKLNVRNRADLAGRLHLTMSETA